MTTQQAAWRGGRWQVPFFTIWTGQAFSLLGSSLVQFALVWWLTAETGSATILALATLVAMLPGILLGPLAGTLVDRWNRRRVMIVADSVIALVSLWLALLFMSGAVQVWQIYVVILIRSMGGAFHWPAMQASTTLMVPEKHLARVSGMNQTLQGLQSIVSPPLGALLLKVLPIAGILYIDLGTALLAVLPLLFIDLPQPDRRPAKVENGAAVKPSMWQEMREGFRYMWAWPGLMAVIVLAVVLNLLAAPTFSLMPLLVKDHFGGGPDGFAALEAAWGIGMLVGGVTLSVWGGGKRRALTAMVALIVQGFAILTIGLAPASALALAVAAMLVAGFTNTLVNGPLIALLQSTVAADMQGRIFSVISAAAQAMTPLGLLVAGPFADAFGVRLPYVICGVVTFLMGAGALFVPAIMNIESNRQASAGTGDAVEVATGGEAAVPAPVEAMVE